MTSPSIEHSLAAAAESGAFAPVVPCAAGRDRVLRLDLSVNNAPLRDSGATVTGGLAEWVAKELAANGANIGVGGYLEERQLYGQSEHFGGAEPRTIHLGLDIWVPPGTPIFAPLAGRVHSFKNNRNFLDYGPTILLEHEIAGVKFLSLYGHLAAASHDGLLEGKGIAKGEQFAVLGDRDENGNWPPHLHLQLILDPGEWRGDYPGVGERSKLDQYRSNCPNPELICPWI